MKTNNGEKSLAKAVISLVVAVLTVSLSILIAGSKAFGWFLANKISDVNGASVGVINSDLHATYSVYAYDLYDYDNPVVSDEYRVEGEESGQTVTKKFDIKNLTMNSYDRVFSQRNEYTPVVVRISLVGEKDLPTSGSVSVTIARNARIEVQKTEYLSSVVKFCCVSGADIYNDDVKTMYANVLSRVNGGDVQSFKEASVGGNVKSFVSKNGEAYERANAVQFSIDYTAEDFNGNVLNLYLYIDYDKQFIEEYISENMSYDLNLDDISREIENDLVSISARPDKKEAQ